MRTLALNVRVFYWYKMWKLCCRKAINLYFCLPLKKGCWRGA